ncbi:MAG: hypothetical protein IT493_11985 [Gammaproteobacteria bacterium]|nr:hypothetical protein [Gammaproteobacteria bacterium]
MSFDYEGKVHFPKYLYYPGGRCVLVKDETEQTAAESGWYDNPGAATEVAAVRDGDEKGKKKR